MLNFCTLFDHNYLSRGLSLYDSLKLHCKDDFKLFILALDDKAFTWLEENRTAYKEITVCSLTDIKNAYPILEQLQNERTRAEFSWTLSSFSIQYFLKKYTLNSITYLDSDIYFYSDPAVLFDELNDESVIITPHNYTPKYDQTMTSGRYCVQFMYFKNNEDGNKVLEWWRNECEKCCCSIPMDGKFGDQKYLDDWLSRFAGIVHEEKHMGCGIAPWNVQQFEILNDNDQLYIQNKITKVKDKLIFYHFHGLKEFINEQGTLLWDYNSGYEYDNIITENIYKPYINNLLHLIPCLPEQNYPIITKKKQPSFFYVCYRTIKRTIKLFLKSFLFWNTYYEIKQEYIQ